MLTVNELREHARAWGCALDDEGLSPHTVRLYTGSVNALAAWQQDRAVTGITREAVRGFTAAILGGGGARATARARVKALKQFAKWLDAEGIEATQLTGLKAPSAGEPIIEPLTEQEIAALIGQCRKQQNDLIAARNEALLRFALDVPVRASEPLGMCLPDDLRFSPERRAVIRKGKGGTQRIAAFGSEAAASLARYLRVRQEHGVPAAGPLWVTVHGTPLKYKGLQESFGSMAEAAGIRGFYLHRMRNTAAVLYLMRGGDRSNLKTLGGWKKLDQIDHYVRAARDQLALREADRLFG